MREQLKPGTYRGRAESWVDDTIETKTRGDQPVLRVTFNIPFDDGGAEQLDWICWAADLYNDQGAPSANLRGLQACGVTTADVQGWMQTGTLTGLDRNDVDLVVEHNDRGYAFVRWVNGQREARVQKPLDRGTKAMLAKKLLGALQAAERQGGAAPSPAQQPPPPRQGRPAGRIDPPPRRPEDDPGFSPDSWVEDDKAF